MARAVSAVHAIRREAFVDAAQGLIETKGAGELYFARQACAIPFEAVEKGFAAHKEAYERLLMGQRGR